MKPNQSSLSSTINQDVSSLLRKNYGNLITIIIFALYVCFTETMQATKVLWPVLNLYKQNNNN